MTDVDNKVKYKSSGGVVKFKGPKRSSNLAREMVAKDVAMQATKRNFKVVDVLFRSNIGRIYFFIMKGLSQAKLIVRMLIKQKQHGHGYIRPKKERRT